jgi:hypothetical protein
MFYLELTLIQDYSTKLCWDMSIQQKTISQCIISCVDLRRSCNGCAMYSSTVTSVYIDR